MEGLRRSLYYIFLSVDLFILLVSYVTADLISKMRLPDSLNIKLIHFTLPEIFTFLILLILWYFFSKITTLYDEIKNYNFISELLSLLKNIFFQLAAGVFLLFALKDKVLSRFFLMVFILILFLLTIISRIFFRIVRRNLTRKNKFLRRVIVVGSGESGTKYFESAGKGKLPGYTMIGVVKEKQNRSDGKKYLGRFKDLKRILTEKNVDEVIIALKGGEEVEIDEILNITGNFPVRVRVIPDFFKFISNKFQISFFNNIPVIDVRNDPLDELHWRIVKRSFDIIFSVFFIVFIFSWLGIIISIAVKISSKGPVFFKQDRWGRKNKKITLYKFRSMIKESRDLDKKGKFVQAKKGDARITKVGKFLRKTSLDELPQFFNVLKGDMSVVGPRPHAVPQNIESRDKIKNYTLRHLVKPGITGWAQVSGLRGETKSSKEMEKRVAYDMFYIENWSFWFDVRIIFLTVWRGLKGDPNAY
ncbi:MAG: undecaprenyl-phosphate glucose phosphotransferase [Acidobacteriota bacterium]